MFQFGSFALLTKAASQSGAGEGFLSRGVCGAMSGICATLTSFPFDVARTRLIAQGEPKVSLGCELCMDKYNIYTLTNINSSLYQFLLLFFPGCSDTRAWWMV